MSEKEIGDLFDKEDEDDLLSELFDGEDDDEEDDLDEEDEELNDE